MALKNLIELEGNVFVNTTYGPIAKGKDSINGVFYVKIENVSANKEKASLLVSFKNDKLNFSKNYSFNVSVVDDAPNFIKQAYLHLKSLPEFSNAENC